MRWVHTVTVEVFAKEDDDRAEVEAALRDFIPFDMEEEKVAVDVEKAVGFQDKVINILTIVLTKESHTNMFLRFLLEKLTAEQKKLLIKQAESRLDPHFHFFIRFDKDTWMESRTLKIIDGGDCFHVKLALASYPKKKETALPLIEKLLSQKSI